MKIKLVSISIILKLMQGIFAYLNIGFQSHALTVGEFNYLSIIGNSIILSVFLDLGVGVQFIQNYFKKVKDNSVKDEDGFALKYLAINALNFVFIACFQSVLISIYASIYLQNKVGHVNLDLIATTFCVTLLFSFTSLVSRIMIARGYVGESVLFQLAGILGQFLFTFFAFQINLDLIAFIFSLAFPNIITAALSLIFMKRKTILLNPHSNQGHIQSSIDHSPRVLSSKLQLLQLLQFAIGTVPILIVTSRVHESGLIAVLIQWRIFSSVSASLSSLNSIEWRASALARTQQRIRSPKSDIELMRKIILTIGISFPIIVVAHFSWGYLANGNANTDLFTWIIWVFYVVAQVYQWHYYYKLLSISEYVHIIVGTFLQLNTTIISMLILNSHVLSSFPFSMLLGLILSGLYMQIRSTYFMKINGRMVS